MDNDILLLVYLQTHYDGPNTHTDITLCLFSGPKHFEHDGHHYWFSGEEENYTDHKVDWLDGRNICREYCMDLVSLETPSENDMITKYLTDSKLNPRFLYQI